MDVQPFQFVPHTADVAAVICGRDFAALLRKAAGALYCLAVVAPERQTECSRALEIESVDSDALLVDWLNELIYYLYVEGLVFKKFSFDRLHEGRLRAVCTGNRLGVGARGPAREIKAATYHMAHIEGQAGAFSVRIVFDV